MLRVPAAIGVVGNKYGALSWLMAHVSMISINGHQQPKSTNVDAIDSFTNDLVTRKSAKWKHLQDKLLSKDLSLPIGAVAPTETTQPITAADTYTGHWRNSAVKLLQELTNLRDVELELDLRKLSQQQVDHLLINALLDERKKNFYALVEQCIRVQRLPSDQVVFKVLDFLTRSADLHRTEHFARLVHSANVHLFNHHDGFSHYRARCLWHQGQWLLALDELKQSYMSMRAQRLVHMPVTILAFFREMVDDAVYGRHGGEAVLQQTISTAQYLSDVFGENQVLAFIWQSCFLSDLFSDQQLAVQMFGDNEDVRLAVRPNALVYTLLQNHNVDAVHRLIELLLRFDMRQECKRCLTFLFEYQYWRRDLRACSEIMRNSLDINLPLADVYNQKLLNLLLGGSSTSAAIARRPTTTATSKESAKFELRF